ncbi:MAG: DUF3780 domain-containing protein [Akkermansiaceae bacterium]|nr:DUF3780 domain-containing protein [Akkermansiaceae bacterium]
MTDYRKPAPKKKAKAAPAQPKAEGFGFQAARSQHHFMVTLPAGKEDHVLLSEHFHFDDAEARRELHFVLGKEDDKLRCVLHLTKWEAIAEAIKSEFNERLKSLGLPAGRWGKRQTPVSRLLGKEMLLLAWAIEDADPALIPIAIANWRGLAPEERWWLFTMTNAATGHALHGKGRGWRKAVRFALTENPAADAKPVQREDFFTLVQEQEPRKI